MAHRLQVLLEEEQYRLLLEESRRSGLSLGALIRAAVDQRFGRAVDDSVALAALEESAGVWDLDSDGESYVDALRPGRWRPSDGDPSRP